jgi:glutamate-5-semialdehyde dehydrogenase
VTTSSLPRPKLRRRPSRLYPVATMESTGTGTATSIAELCARAKRASRALAAVDSATKDAALAAIAAALRENADEILEANHRDLQDGESAGLSDALMDRLALDERRLDQIADGVLAIAALPDPVGELIDGHTLPNGLAIRRVRVPLGVVAVVYEARPNVTIDAAALCLKSGNAIVLRGSSIAAHSNAALASVATRIAEGAGLPEGSLSLVAGGGREELAELATQSDTVDLIIPRGGEGLKAALSGVATVPVIYAASGNNHVYVDAGADLAMARAIVLNAKLQRPGVCNAAETLLVHADVASAFLAEVCDVLGDAGVVLHGDARARAAAPDVEMAPATEADWDTEYLALEMAVAVVDSTADAIDHVNAHGSGHSEAIVTADLNAAHAFQLGVDAACVYVNASTRFTDGGEFGMGAEIGNSTQKLHVRGPIGLRELCTLKYLVHGSGQIRV